MEKSDLEKLRWHTKNEAQSAGPATGLAGLVIYDAVREFKASSDKLGKRMLALTWALVVLTAMLVVLTVKLIVTT